MSIEKEIQQVVAIVVLYNPEKSIYKRYEELSKQFSKIFYIDNSTSINDFQEYVKNKKNVLYFNMGGGVNTGLAKALNFGCSTAIKSGFKYAMLFDQDTHLTDNLLLDLTQYIDSDNDIALIAPNIKLYHYGKQHELLLSKEQMYPDGISYPDWVITSGSLIDLAIYQKVGGFDDKLFIMLIDQDYCCNLISKGYRILLNGDTYIFQEAGKTTVHNFLGREIKDPNYSKERYYYIFRNEHYCRLKWKKNYQRQRVSLWKYVVIILLFDKSKCSKIFSCLRGWFECYKMKS